MANRSLPRVTGGLALPFILALGSAPPVGATTYEVGDGKPLPTHNVVREYVKHLSSVPRAVNGPFDIGAYEF